MDDKKIQNFITTIGEQFINLGQQMAELRASVTVLKSLAILDLSPEDPIGAATQLRNLEQIVLKSDPETSVRQQAADVIEAVKLWKQHGGGKHEA
jgi:hypothetical protein